MTLNESITEEAALEWSRLRQGYAGQVGELGYAAGHGARARDKMDAGGAE
jgi:hypothetical protein